MATRKDKLKPLFEEERVYLQKQLGIEIPEQCWKTGAGTQYIYDDIYSDDYIICFKVDGWGNFTLIDNKPYQSKLFGKIGWSDCINREKDRLEDYWEFAKNRLKTYMEQNPERDYSCNTSGGKDSEVVYMLTHEVVDELSFQPKIRYHFTNTTNESYTVYRHIKSLPDIEIHNPKEGWYNWVESKNGILPSVLHRSCCSHFKEKTIAEIYGKDTCVSGIYGMRAPESNKRKDYRWFMDWDADVEIHGSSNQSKNHNKICPIIEMTDTDVWLMLLLKGGYIDEKYKWGFRRVGCTVCPYSSDYDDVLNRKYFPKMMERWDKLTKWVYSNVRQGKLNVDEDYFEQRLDEWVHGAWKMGNTGETEVLSAIETDEDFEKTSKILGMSVEMLKKYKERIGKPCPMCDDKVVGFMALSMFYKLNGRYEGREDNRKVPCKSCQMKMYGWKKRDWADKLRQFQLEGCNLF